MDIDDLEPRRAPLLPLHQEDLSLLSIDELEERINDLQAEIARCEAMIHEKRDSRADAEMFFKK